MSTATTSTAALAASPVAVRSAVQIKPCTDAAQLRKYIDEHWRSGHVLARDERMFAFQYSTPWVDRTVFPQRISVLGAYESGRLVGFLGSIVAPYPRPQSYWLALWHVLPEFKGGGLGGKLLSAMQEIAVGSDGGGTGERMGWIGTFGAGPEALPVYLKRGYACRAVRRWLWTAPDDFDLSMIAKPAEAPTHSAEWEPGEKWLRYRFDQHPVFQYTTRTSPGPSGPTGGGIFRTEENSWGVVTHCCRLFGDWRGAVRDVAREGREQAARLGKPYVLDCWSFDAPGGLSTTGVAAGLSTKDACWTLAPDDLPSVFHPPTARGNLIYATAKPFLPTRVGKGECDQDRPN